MFNDQDNVFGSLAKDYGQEKMMEPYRKSRRKAMKYFNENRPGYKLEDRALAHASWIISRLGILGLIQPIPEEKNESE